jgi:phosphatidylglycerol:prolipoprotein diacylglycerol transferase
MFPILSIGPLSLPLPPLALILGFWLGSLLSEKMAQRFGIRSNKMDNLLWLSLFAGILGARLSYIARNPWAFRNNFASLISVNPYLLDPVGGLMIAITVLFLLITRYKLDYWKYLDYLTPFFVVILAALHFSFFASGRFFGVPTTWPLAIYLWGAYRHPVQLYMLCGNLINLLILLVLYKKTLSSPGKLFLLFSCISTGMYLFFSGFQENEILLISGIRLNQVVFWLLFGFSLVLLVKYSKLPQMEITHES